MKIKYFLGDERRGRLDREERGGERGERGDGGFARRRRNEDDIR